MNVVYTYYFGKACKWWDDRNPAEFQYNLTDNMIENWWTERSTRINKTEQPIQYPGYIKYIVPNCNPTKKKRKIKTPDHLKDIKLLAQSRCKVYRGGKHIFF